MLGIHRCFFIIIVYLFIVYYVSKVCVCNLPFLGLYWTCVWSRDSLSLVSHHGVVRIYVFIQIMKKILGCRHEVYWSLEIWTFVVWAVENVVHESWLTLVVLTSRSWVCKLQSRVFNYMHFFLFKRHRACQTVESVKQSLVVGYKLCPILI